MTKATFFDVVADLSMEAFLASLRHFTALYGLPHDIYSDNGTNFVGASAELQRLQEVLEANESKEQISHWAASKGVSWHFSPGRAPHFGSLWEAAVCAMKMTIRKVTGEQKLRHDELTTLLYEASAVLNSRSLAPLDTLAADGIALLTPGHFLIGGPPAALLSKPDIDFKSTYGKRWKLVEHMTINLWKRWRTEYLLLLQRRNKWNLPGMNLRPGDLVLLKDSDTFQRTWPMGHVSAVFKGSDGLVRVADVTIGRKTYKRPIHKLVMFLGEDDVTSPRRDYVQAT